MRSGLGTGTIGLLAALGCAFPVATASADSMEPAARITAAEGESTEVPDGRLAEGETFETGSDGKCAMLVDGNAAIEACGDTALRFVTGPNGARVVQVDRGRIRIVVEPREDSARIEIHSQAAVATLLGTIAYLDVDAETQATTVTSAESRVLVTSTESDVSGNAVLEPGEQVTVKRGQAPTPKRVVDLDELAKSQCSFDYRRLALEDDREETVLWLTDRASEDDGRRALRALSDANGNGGGNVPASIAPDPGADDPIEGTDEVCAGTDCVPIDEGFGSSAQQVRPKLP